MERNIKLSIKASRKLYIILAIVIVVLVVLAAVLLMPPANTAEINRASCESSGGTWNECGSPCTGAPQGTVCIQVCRQQCEWYAGSAEVAKKSAYAAQQGFSCMTQDNGITMCWLSN